MLIRLQTLRLARGLSLEAVAAQLQVTPKVYAAYESGRRTLPASALVTLAQMYNVSADYLLERTDWEKPYPPAVK